MYQNLKEYLIEKGDKTDIMSSLQKLDKTTYKDFFLYNRVGVKNIEDLAKYKFKLVKKCFDELPNDPSSVYYYSKLIKYENTSKFRPAGADIEDFVVFIYMKRKYLSYYIPDEMKELILEYLENSRDIYNFTNTH